MNWLHIHNKIVYDKPECLCYVAALNTNDDGGDDDDNDDDVNCGVCEGDGDSEITTIFPFSFQVPQEKAL